MGILGDQILFEQRMHNQRGRTGILEAQHQVEILGERRRPRYEGVRQHQSEIASR
jgi:hypothetical protein